MGGIFVRRRTIPKEGSCRGRMGLTRDLRSSGSGGHLPHKMPTVTVTTSARFKSDPSSRARRARFRRWAKPGGIRPVLPRSSEDDQGSGPGPSPAPGEAVALLVLTGRGLRPNRLVPGVARRPRAAAALADIAPKGGTSAWHAALPIRLDRERLGIGPRGAKASTSRPSPDPKAVCVFQAASSGR